MMESYPYLRPFLLRKLGITGIDFLYLYFLETGESFGINFKQTNICKNKLLRLKLIKTKTSGKTKTSKKAKYLLEKSLTRQLMTKKEKEAHNKDLEFDAFALEYRSKWFGLKPGSMGSKLACTLKLRKWMYNNPSYTKEQILEAATQYLNTEGRNTRFLQQADCFIYKRDRNGDDLSRLDGFIK